MNFRARLTKRNVVLSAITLSISSLFVAWALFRLGFPRSPSELVASVHLQQATGNGAGLVLLTDVMPGDWERVCYMHPYFGALELPKDGKNFDSRAWPTDDGWDLFFIAPDGSHRTVSNTRTRAGFEVSAGKSRCVERNGARLVRRSDSTNSFAQYTLSGTGVL